MIKRESTHYIVYQFFNKWWKRERSTHRAARATTRNRQSKSKLWERHRRMISIMRRTPSSQTSMGRGWGRVRVTGAAKATTRARSGSSTPTRPNSSLQRPASFSTRKPHLEANKRASKSKSTFPWPMARPKTSVSPSIVAFLPSNAHSARRQ